MGFKVNGNALDCYPALWMWHHFVSIAAGEPTKQSYKAVVLTETGVQLFKFSVSSSPILGWQSPLRNLSIKAISMLILST